MDIASADVPFEQQEPRLQTYTRLPQEERTLRPEQFRELEQQLTELTNRFLTFEELPESAHFLPTPAPPSSSSSSSNRSAPAEEPPPEVEKLAEEELHSELPKPEVKPSARPARAVTALADQLEHPSAGVRKAAARSLSRLAEAALRRGLVEVTLEHAGVLADMHLDANSDVREVAFSALTQVRQAAEEHPSGAAINASLSEHLSHHAATRFYRGPPREPARAEPVMTPARQRTGSWAESLRGCGATQSSSSRSLHLASSLSDTNLLATRSVAQKFMRPKHMSREAMRRTKVRQKEEAKEETRELLQILRKSESADADKEGAQCLAQQLDDPDAWVRASAAMALGHLGQAAQPYVGLLMHRLTDRDSFVRAAAAVSVGKLPKPSPPTGISTSTRRSRGVSSRSPSRKRRVKNSRSASHVGSQPRSTSLSGGALGPNSLARAGSATRVGQGSGSPGGVRARPGSAPGSRQRHPAAASRPSSAKRGSKVAWSGVASPASLNSSQNQLSFEAPPGSMQNSKSGLSRLSGSTAQLLPQSNVDKIVIRCCCGLQAARQQARSGGPNEGRFFYCCPQEKGQHCNMFVWEPD